MLVEKYGWAIQKSLFAETNQGSTFSHTRENSKMFNISSKYFSFFNNKPPTSWIPHITRHFLTCYSCSYYSSMKYLRKKNSIVFPCGTIFLDFLIKCLSKCPNFTKPPVPWKISGCAPTNDLFRVMVDRMTRVFKDCDATWAALIYQQSRIKNRFKHLWWSFFTKNCQRL